jgi:acyl-CoA synthetase (AMP-forming)/AMP-acid ligase II
VELFLARASERPDQDAVVQGGRSTTYADLREKMLRAEALLRSKGVRVGDRVLVYVPPSADLYALLLATWRSGAVAVFVDAWTSRRRLGRVVELVEPALFVGVAKAHLLRLTDPRVRRIPSCLWWRDRCAQGDPGDAREVDPDSTALVTFTTGSTGSPKGAARSHRFLLAQHQALQRVLETAPGSVDLATLPIFGLHDLASGATCHLASIDPARPDSFDPPALLAQLRRADSSAGSPAVYLKLADSTPRLDPSVRAKIHLGGAAVHPWMLSRLMRAFPNASWHATYGSSEVEPISTLDGRILSEWNGPPELGLPAGTPDESLSVRILDPREGPIRAACDADLDSQVPIGEVGEIVVAGPHVLSGYWNDPDADAANKIRTRERTWHRTGDAGWLDGSGGLHLLGRVRDRIERDGATYWPLAMERRLAGVHGIAAGCVLEHRGVIFAVVELVPGADKDAVGRAVRSMEWPFPLQLRFQELPRDPRHRSKIDLGALRDRLDRRAIVRWGTAE